MACGVVRRADSARCWTGRDGRMGAAVREYAHHSHVPMTVCLADTRSGLHRSCAVVLLVCSAFAVWRGLGHRPPRIGPRNTVCE